MMRVTLVLGMLVASVAGAREMYDNVNNVAGVDPGRDLDGINKYIGKKSTLRACEEATASFFGMVYFAESDDAFSTMCYGVYTSMGWAPVPQYGVYSLWDHSAVQTPCTTAEDCSQNGKCTNGFCECDAQWYGSRCSVLRFKEAVSNKLGLKRDDLSSWGGSVLYDETDGLYHMWAAEMVKSCGIRVWLTNSVVRHATSPDPLTVPFTPREVTVGLWAHEPTAARDPTTGQWGLFFTGMFAPNIPCTNHTCNNCSHGSTAPNDATCPNDQHCDGSLKPLPLSSWVIYSNSSNGPWSEPQRIPAPGYGDTNLSPIIQKDGSLIGLGRPPYVWRSPNWKDASQYTFEKAAGNIWGEDPFLYRGSGDVLHAIFHGGGWAQPYGLHFWSTDGAKTWNDHNDIHCYNSKVTYTNGTAESLSRRERPHLVFDKTDNTKPIALTNGATPVWPCSEPDVCPIDYCYTSLQPLNLD